MHAIDESTTPLLETASDELARFDTLCGTVPPAIGIAYRIDAIARCALLAAPSSQSIGEARSSLVASTVEAVHASALGAALVTWRRIVDDEERKARSGVPLTAARLLGVVGRHDGQDIGVPPQVAALPQHATIERQALLPRGVALAASLHDRAGSPPELVALATLAPALVLCAGGRLDRVCLLPFAEIPAAERNAALSAWHDGDATPFVSLALTHCTASARHRRLAMRGAMDRINRDQERLAPLGRAAITARRALDVLRQTLATSMPAASEWLDCSRPAAGAALERLVEVGLAREITGRGRDRVYVDAVAWDLLDAA